MSTRALCEQPVVRIIRKLSLILSLHFRLLGMDQMSEIQFKTRKIVAGLMMFASVIFLTSCALDSSTTSSDTTISTESNSTEDDSSSSVSTEEESYNSTVYDSAYGLMETLYASADSPLTDYWINQQNGGKVSYCVRLEKAAEQDAGVTLDAVQTQDWVNACIDFLTSVGY